MMKMHHLRFTLLNSLNENLQYNTVWIIIACCCGVYMTMGFMYEEPHQSPSVYKYVLHFKHCGEHLPGCICEYAMRPVCRRSLIPLWCSPNQRRLLQQTPRAHWSAWSLCSPPEYPSGSASPEPWPPSLHTEY